MPPKVRTSPPARSRVAGGLAALACAACCALPPLIAAGLLTAGTAAVFERTMLAVSASLVVLGLGMWWLHRRRTLRAHAAGADIDGGTGTGSAGHGGCADGNCSC